MQIKKLQKHLASIADVNYAINTLCWDQETYLPPNSSEFRANQTATLSSLSHKLFTSSKTSKLIEKCKSEKLSPKEKKILLLTQEELEKQSKYPNAFVHKLSLAISNSFNAWQSAKKQNKFSIFRPHLERLISLKRKECDLLKFSDHPYNALLHQYEKNITVKDLDALFQNVRNRLFPLIKKINNAPQISNDIFLQHFDKQKQWDFSMDILRKMGFDLTRGRQDISSHPFTTTLSPSDVRTTTRVNEKDLSEIIWSSIHEGGHALYEQGLPAAEYGNPLSEAVSLGIHESQSRLWENNVGRGLPFWKYFFPILQKYFPAETEKFSPAHLFNAMNRVQPNLIRTNSDELTYHAHIIIRYEIEKAILEEKVKTKELPELWNSLYKEYLGLTVPNYSSGILQDVHWSHGSFGYFPTYSIGSFYAAQFYTHAKQKINNLEAEFELGNFSPLLSWLRLNIHQHGKFFTADELSKNITGESLNFDYFMKYAEEKYGKIYNLKIN